MGGGVGMWLRSVGAPTLPETAPKKKKRKKKKTEEQKTYREWQENGYQVQRGETASGRNANGVATFLRSQVRLRISRYGGGDPDDRDHDFHGMSEEEFLGYTPGSQ